MDLALRNHFEESPSMIQDEPMVKDEPLENYDDQMMSGLTVSVSLDFTEAVAETNVPHDQLEILKQFFYTETSMTKEDVFSKISKIFLMPLYQRQSIVFSLLHYSSNHKLNFDQIFVQKWVLQNFDLW